MRKKCFIATAMVTVSLFCAGNVFAADVTAAVDVNSAYVWRGITFNDGVVVQPSVDVTKGGFGFNVWGNLDADDYDNTLESGEFSEIDLTASYGFTVKSVSFTVGYIEYLFPAGGAGTREVFGGIGFEPVKGLTTGVDIYWDFDEVEDYYMKLNLGYSRAIIDQLSMNFNASAGYAGENMSMAYGGTKDGFYDYNISLGLGYTAATNLNLSGFIAYADSFDDEVLPDQDVDVYGGVGMSYSF